MKIERYIPNRDQFIKIGERLRKIRTANELSIEEFASRICCHPFDYGRTERGVESYSGSVLKLISYEFGVSLSWIMQGVPAETDPDFCTEDKDGKQIFESCIDVQEAMWEYTTNNGVDMWSDGVEKAIDDIHRHIKYRFKDVDDKDEKLIDDDLRDAIYMANADGYTVGWRTAIQLMQKMLNINAIPDAPPAPSVDRNRTMTPAFITSVRKVTSCKKNT